MALNHITIMGRLTANPELRHTTAGAAVTNFTIAVGRDFADKQSGEKETDFIEVVAWRNTAEFVTRYFTKGRTAVVSGRLQVRTWTDKDGNARKTAEIVADSVYFGDSNKEPANKNTGAQTHTDAFTATPQQTTFAPVNFEDDDLPF